MFTAQNYTESREKNYELVIKQLKALIEDEPNQVTNLANASALLNQFLDQINWVGFYLNIEEELVLGPFQGLPACVRIPIGKGVCGTAAGEKKTYVVPDVNLFPGHIFCDGTSASEIVVPIVKDGQLIGVLDIDSPIKDRFDEVDKEYLERFVMQLTEFI